MDILRTILDGIMMAVYFNGLAAVFILINPRYFFSSYPKSIQQAASNSATKEEKKAMRERAIFGCCSCPAISIG